MERGAVTLDQECDVGHPYARCNCYNHPVFVPNGDSRGLHERLIDEDREAWRRTYTRSNINNDAAIMAMEPKIYKM